MKLKEINIGWVVAFDDGIFTSIISSTFAITRTEAIANWMKIWDESRTNWRKFKRQGYQCVRAKQIIEI